MEKQSLPSRIRLFPASCALRGMSTEHSSTPLRTTGGGPPIRASHQMEIVREYSDHGEVV